MYYCGIDLGKTSSHFCVVDASGAIIRRGKCKTVADTIAGRLRGLEEVQIVLEASYKTFWLADQLETHGFDVVVCDPGRTKAIGAARIKNDRLDAHILAMLLAKDFVARVSRPSANERMRRMPCTSRAQLVRTRVSLANTLRSLLASEGVEIRAQGPLALMRAVGELLANAEIPEPIAQAISPLVSAIEGITASIRELDAVIERAVQQSEPMQRLMTVPGVGPLTAAAFVSALGNPERFQTGRHVSSYLGLVPTLYSSGNVHRVGGITKRGNKQVRWLFCMAANALLRTRRSSRLRDWAVGLLDRMGRKKAIVAIARKLARILWVIWKKGAVFVPQHLARTLPAPAAQAESA